MMSTTMPTISTTMVFFEHPFHSFSMMPHTFENTTLSAISMQKERVISVSDAVRKPLPSDRPKNWLYHNAPAPAHNTIMVPRTPLRA